MTPWSHLVCAAWLILEVVRSLVSKPESQGERPSASSEPSGIGDSSTLTPIESDDHGRSSGPCGRCRGAQAHNGHIAQNRCTPCPRACSKCTPGTPTHQLNATEADCTTLQGDAGGIGGRNSGRVGGYHRARGAQPTAGFGVGG